MAKPPTIQQVSAAQAAQLDQLAGFTKGDATVPVTVPASITHTWDTFTTTLGRTVPANLARARAATRALPGGGR